jgi:hypothetical protein
MLTLELFLASFLYLVATEISKIIFRRNAVGSQADPRANFLTQPYVRNAYNLWKEILNRDQSKILKIRWKKF